MELSAAAMNHKRACKSLSLGMSPQVSRAANLCNNAVVLQLHVSFETLVLDLCQHFAFSFALLFAFRLFLV